MKKLLLVSVAGVALVAAGAVNSADAADIYRKAPPVVAPVAPPPPPFSWTGCYIGAHIGAGWGTKTWLDQGGDDFSDNTSYNVNGFLGGGQIGCDYQWSSPVVIGFEATFSGTDIKGASVQPFEIIPAIGSEDPNPESAAVSTKLNWLITLTGRVGFSVDHALIYVKGGGAWVREKHTTTELVPEGFSDAGESDTQTLTSTRSGWLVGTGIEYAFLPNWSAKLEYNYANFGHKSFLFDALSDDPVSIKQDLHTVKFGINYRFNWGKAPFGKSPVVARY